MQTASTNQYLEQIAKALGRSSLFDDLDHDQRLKVAGYGQLAQVAPGGVLVKAGDKSDCFYIILSGEASVWVTDDKRGEDTRVASLGAIDILGELGVLLEQPRSATVKAETKVTAVRFAEQALEAMFEQLKGFGMAVSRALGRRLVATSKSVPVPDHEGGLPSPKMLELLPRPFMERQRVLVVKQEGQKLTLGFVDEPSAAVVDAVRRHLPSYELGAVRIDRAFFERAITSSRGHRESTGMFRAEQLTSGVSEATADTIDLKDILRRMVSEGASDLHISAGNVPRWRVDGEIQLIRGQPKLGPETVRHAVAEILPEDIMARFTGAKEMDAAYTLEGVARFRIAVFKDTRGVSAVFRQIPSKIPDFDQLGIPEAVRQFCTAPRGLVLVTGPTGSGKSTTLAAMLNEINNKRPDHLLTLEDPVEFVHTSKQCLVNHREIHAHTESFADALRAALRQDPDIVLVGEMRDLETISLALETANTGHLVFGTLHTSTAIGTVNRIVNQFPSEQQNRIRSTMSEVLRGVVSQTLCKKIGGGRVAGMEIMVVNPGIANLIREGKTHQIGTMMSTHLREGNMILNTHLTELIQQKKIEPEEAIRCAVDKNDMEARVNKMKFGI
jgi:twitching motility protein PilT